MENILRIELQFLNLFIVKAIPFGSKDTISARIIFIFILIIIQTKKQHF